MTRLTSLQVFLTDRDAKTVTKASVTLTGREDEQGLKLNAHGAFEAPKIKPGTYTLTVKPEVSTLEPVSREVHLTPGPNSAVVSLGRKNDPHYPSADGPMHFRGRQDAVLATVRMGEESKFEVDELLEEAGLKRLDLKMTDSADQPLDSDFVLIETPDGIDNATQALSGFARLAARRDANVIFGAVIERGKENPLQGLTNEMVVRFGGDVGDDVAKKILREFGLRIQRTVDYAGNAYMVERAGLPDYDLLELAEKLNSMKEVDYAEPQILYVIENDAFTPNDTLYGLQDNLPLINADEAWDTMDDIDVNLRGGSPDICIAVFDVNGVTPNHPDLTANLTDGASKMLTSFNFNNLTTQTVAGLSGSHGTQTSGTATAAFSNNLGVAGVAPNCRLIGGRIANPATGIEMADAFIWSAGFNTGNTNVAFPAVPTQPADVIANSWGVTNGALSNALRDCFDFLTVYGRNGRGCVVTFSTGNLGYVQFTNVRRFASYERTVAVGASIGANPTNPTNSSGPDPSGNTTNIAAITDQRALYNPFGPEMDIVAPSHTAYDGGLVDPTTTTVNVGTGALNGAVPPVIANDYSTNFGGTSHASPTIAGTAALVLSMDPSLNWIQVRNILRTTAVRIHAGNTDPTGSYVDNDGDGVAEFSQWYGYGRVNVDAAVIAARDGAFASDVVVRENQSDTGAVPSPGWHAHSPDIWVRATNDPIPALAYNANPPHQNAVRGQDNYVFARVRNNGVATATEVYVRGMICHYPGFEFRYPQEFIPSIRPGDPIPNPLVPGTYLIDEIRVDDLLPGEDRIVKMTWPEALIPPASVMVSGSTVNWHPCLLLEASPHDGPVAASGSAIDIRRFNNICQRNITIDDATDSSSDLTGIIGGFMSGGRTRSLVVDASRFRQNERIILCLGDEKLMAQLLRTVKEGAVKSDLPPLGAVEEAPDKPEIKALGREFLGGITFRSEALMELELVDNRRLEMLVSPSTRFRLRDQFERPRSAATISKYKGKEVVVLRGGSVYELPVSAGERQLFPLMIGSPEARGSGAELRITQRRSDGELAAGYAIQY
ncbi:S8 family serine peptidase [uncultured Tateyamaria sp.]|uniref:S8 family serine peptidase n=1 Tax=uncultured Tateyamaria sp. TaxID=455651 RepID=UPI0026165744|nr:S8 family serine peptidase [uncultured Tateyamaria sp.]